MAPNEFTGMTMEFTPEDLTIIIKALTNYSRDWEGIDPERVQRTDELLEAIADEQEMSTPELLQQIADNWPTESLS